MYNFCKWFYIFLISSLVFTQEIEPCDGHCLSEGELNRIVGDMKDLEVKLDFSNKEILLLNSIILDHEKNDSLNVSLINNYKNQLIWKEEMIDLVKPKWYHNRYIWFGLGIAFTSGSVMLAGQIN